MTVQTSRSPGAAIRAAAATAHPAAAPRQAWLIVALLFLFMVINFADKAVIGIAAVPIMDELLLSPREFGLLGSSFFLLFAVSAIVTGFIVNRVETRWALLVMGLVWALTQFPMLGTVGFGTIMAARIALGVGEGPAYPVALHSTYKWFPNELRTLPTAIVAEGAGIGIMIALPLMLNWVIVRYSWHWAFGVLGIAGLLWTAATSLRRPRHDRGGHESPSRPALHRARSIRVSTRKADGRKYVVQVNAVCAHEDPQAGVSISMSGALPSLSTASSALSVPKRNASGRLAMLAP